MERLGLSPTRKHPSAFRSSSPSQPFLHLPPPPTPAARGLAPSMALAASNPFPGPPPARGLAQSMALAGNTPFGSAATYHTWSPAAAPYLTYDLKAGAYRPIPDQAAAYGTPRGANPYSFLGTTTDAAAPSPLHGPAAASFHSPLPVPPAAAPYPYPGAASLQSGTGYPSAVTPFLTD
jgi:hypothetical protein